MTVQWGMLGNMGQSNVLDLYRAGVQDRRVDQQFQRQEAADAQKQRLQALLQAAVGPDGRVDQGQVRRAYAEAGDVQTLMEMDEQSAKVARENMPTLLRLVDDATDQASYDRARAAAQHLGIDVSGLPDVFDPAIPQQAKQALGALQTADKPYRWRSNSGDLMEVGPDGQPRVVFDDPDVRPQFIPDGMGGGTWATPPMGGQQGGLPPLPPGFEIEGGPTQPASGGFPR